MSFQIDEKCLCFHGPLLYEAKVLKIYNPDTKTYLVKNEDSVPIKEEDQFPDNLIDEPCFFIHYQGWKSSWDEWVGHDRIRTYNEENLQLKKTLVLEAKEAKQSKKKGKQHGNNLKSQNQLEKNLRKEKSPISRIPPTNNRKSQSSKFIMKIPIKLKSLLVDDWEYVVKERKIIELPCITSVEKILDNFYNERSQVLDSPVEQSQLYEFICGLKLYFNRCLGVFLLYRLERLQYDEQLKLHQNFQPIDTYGIIHLIRLISLIPELICSTTMDEKSCQIMTTQCEFLLSWISDNTNDLFGDLKYINTSAQYEGIALNM